MKGLTLRKFVFDVCVGMYVFVLCLCRDWNSGMTRERIYISEEF